MEFKFTDIDIAQITAHGLTAERVAGQLQTFRRGFPYIDIDRAATTGDGIMAVNREAAASLSSRYTDALPELNVVKFVPASGAATRMFKELFEFAGTGVHNPSSEKTVREIEKFAFYDLLDGIAEGSDPRGAVQAVLDYGARRPKGLIAFHKYPDGVRTAFEEHLAEGAMYAACRGGVNIHFTVSEEHGGEFRKLAGEAAPKYGERYGVEYRIEFSHQQRSTDTIAATWDNEPFRDDGKLLFRPAGHGALIANLNAIDADAIFIKNIDNVTTDRLKGDTIAYKTLLGGLMLTLRDKIFGYLEVLERGADETQIGEIENFVTGELSYQLPRSHATLPPDRKSDYLRRVLDRPLRVCAMVRNEGEPGGGPFRVVNGDGSRSLQIVEQAQVAPDKKHLFREGTHFNPVDMVCGVKNYKGGKFDLSAYSDSDTGFISEKSRDGRILRALELPGLWNGAMARWNTVFVEAPVSTFTPVKKVTDLFRREHR